MGVVVGEGDAAAWPASGNFKMFKSALLTVKVPSRPSTRAYHVPSLFCAPMLNLCDVLLSGEVVKASTSCGLSKPCCGVVPRSQRTACNADNVLRSDRRLASLI